MGRSVSSFFSSGRMDRILPIRGKQNSLLLSFVCKHQDTQPFATLCNHLSTFCQQGWVTQSFVNHFWAGLRHATICHQSFFFYCPYTLVMRCGRVSRIEIIWWYWISVSSDYTTLPYLTIWHAQTIGVSDLCCLEHTERSDSVTETVFRNLPGSIKVSVRVNLPDYIFLYHQPDFFLSRLPHAYIISSS